MGYVSARECAQPVREDLGGGYVIKKKIPPNAKWCTYAQGDVLVRYIQFVQPVTGGMVNMHLHGAEEQLELVMSAIQQGDKKKSTCICIASINQKTIPATGMTYTYVDLHLAPEDMVVSRRLVLTESIPDETPEVQVFPLAHADGAIVTMPVDAKLKVQPVTVSVGKSVPLTPEALRKQFGLKQR